MYVGLGFQKGLRLGLECGVRDVKVAKQGPNRNQGVKMVLSWTVLVFSANSCDKMGGIV